MTEKPKRELKKFEIVGEKVLKGKKIKFTKTVEALNENMAKHTLLSSVCSKHKIKRRFISIQELKNVDK